MKNNRKYVVRIDGEKMFESFNGQAAYEYASDMYNAMEESGEKTIPAIFICCGTSRQRIANF